MPASEQNPANRTKTGRFAPGFSGNPNGRPKDVAGALFRQMLEADNCKDLREIYEALSSFAKAGNEGCARLLLERSYKKPAMADDDAEALRESGRNPLLEALGIPGFGH